MVPNLLESTDNLELLVLLFPPPQGWDSRSMPLHLIFAELGRESKACCTLGKYSTSGATFLLTCAFLKVDENQH